MAEARLRLGQVYNAIGDYARALDAFTQCLDAMLAAGHVPEDAQLTMRASTNSELGAREAASMIGISLIKEPRLRQFLSC